MRGRVLTRCAALTTAFAALVSVPAPPAAHAVAPVGFTTALVLGHLDAGLGGPPTSFAEAADGRVFIGRKNGIVDVYDQGVQHVFVDLSAEVNSAGGRGLLGLALDPKFASNRRVYVMFTQELDPGDPDSPTPAGGEIVRFTAQASNPDVAFLPSRVTLLRGYDSAAADHADGALRFDTRGKLLASWGDGADDAIGAGQALAAQNLDDLRGKIVRIDRFSGDGVPGNPFYDAADPSSVRSKVFVYGLRNAYRFSIDPDTNTVYAGDVGWHTWEELDTFPMYTTDPLRDRNGGWPCYEGGDGGADRQAEFAVAASTAAACHALYTPQEGGTGIGAAAPLYAYRHDEGGGHLPSAITAGPKYDGTANYPADLDGKLFVADFGRDIFRTVDPVSGAAADFGAAGGWGNPVDIQIAPDGNVAYLGIRSGELREIVYTGPDQVPVAQAGADVTSGAAAPLTVNFSSAGTHDPDPGDTLGYSWDFGDGSPASSEADPSHTYTATGSYHATLTVTDGHPGGLAQSALWIDVANTPPAVTFTAPDPSLRYAIGAVINVAVRGTDAQDGPLPAAALDTQVILVDGGQLHYQSELAGPRGHFTVAEPTSDDSSYELVTTATDSRGRTTTGSFVVLPAKAPTTVQTTPFAIAFTLDGHDTTSPASSQSIVGRTHEAYAPPTFDNGGVTYQFLFWSDGLHVSLDQYYRWTTPASGGVYTAVYARAPG